MRLQNFLFLYNYIFEMLQDTNKAAINNTMQFILR